MAAQASSQPTGRHGCSHHAGLSQAALAASQPQKQGWGHSVPQRPCSCVSLLLWFLANFFEGNKREYSPPTHALYCSASCKPATARCPRLAHPTLPSDAGVGSCQRTSPAVHSPDRLACTRSCGGAPGDGTCRQGLTPPRFGSRGMLDGGIDAFHMRAASCPEISTG